MAAPYQTTMAQPAENTQLIVARIEASAHSSDSSLREQALGHLFLGQLLTFMWRSGARDTEVLKSEVDGGGYDVVLESNGIIRHVQLKSSAMPQALSMRLPLKRQRSTRSASIEWLRCSWPEADCEQ